MNPIDPRRSERHLLAAVHRWARTNGWQRYRGLVFGWQNGDDATATVLITWQPDDPYPLGISWAVGRFDDGSPLWACSSTVRVDSVTQAVDVVVALTDLPAWLSSAYGLAEDRYREQVETLAEEAERLRDGARRAVEDVLCGGAS